MNFKENFSDIKKDMWQTLAECKNPIVLYGMGDGADKIITELEKRGIHISGVFASDGHVPKGEKLFHGYRIESYSQIKNRLGEITVLVAFGTKLEEVLQNILRIAAENELYAPDVPVFGGDIFDLEYFNKNFCRLEKIYDMLCDDISKKAFICSIKYRLTGNMNYLFECETNSAEGFRDMFSPKENCTYIDIGAYNGDTIREFTQHSGKNVSVYAIEPDPRNFRKLTLYAENCSIRDIKLFNAAAWDKNEDITFFSRSGRNSAGTTAHADAKATTVRGISVDSIAKEADFVKIDAEGSDKKALIGMKDLISRVHPCLCVAAYHRTEDYFDIPECVLSMHGEYKLFFRHSRHIPCWDTNFYFLNS